MCCAAEPAHQQRGAGVRQTVWGRVGATTSATINVGCESLAPDGLGELQRSGAQEVKNHVVRLGVGAPKTLDATYVKPKTRARQRIGIERVYPSAGPESTGMKPDSASVDLTAALKSVFV
jgi:hypothetical protein